MSGAVAKLGLRKPPMQVMAMTESTQAALTALERRPSLRGLFQRRNLNLFRPVADSALMTSRTFRRTMFLGVWIAFSMLAMACGGNSTSPGLEALVERNQDLVDMEIPGAERELTTSGGGERFVNTMNGPLLAVLSYSPTSGSPEDVESQVLEQVVEAGWVIEESAAGTRGMRNGDRILVSVVVAAESRVVVSLRPDVGNSG